VARSYVDRAPGSSHGTILRADPVSPGVPEATATAAARWRGRAGDALALAAPPLTVVLALHRTGALPSVFVAYHLVWCLAVPALAWLATGRSGRLRDVVGLRAPGRRGWGAGALLGAATAVGIPVALLLAGDLVPGVDVLGDRLEAWGVPTGASVPLAAYMVLVNSPAEELYWRGFVHERLAAWTSRAAAIGLATAAFTSYHVYTVYALTGEVLATTVMVAGVLAGGLAWAVLREATGSSVPAVLAHAGAAVGYTSLLFLA